MLEFTGYYKQITSGDDDNKELVLGLAAVTQQQAAEDAEYQAQNNTTNPDFYCEATIQGNIETIKELYPLPVADCNMTYFSFDATKNRVIARIDNEFGGATGSCKKTREALLNQGNCSIFSTQTNI